MSAPTHLLEPNVPTSRTLMIGTALASAALILTGCADSPIKHGEVIDKRGYAGSWIPEYEDVYRDNCTTVRTSSFTTSLASRTGGTSGGSSSGRSTSRNSTNGGSSTGGSQPGKSLTGGGTSGTSGSATGGTQPTKRCERQYVGRKQTGQHWGPGNWELQLRDGDRTGWITVSETTYNDTDLHDRI
ncbi:hypothetical protein ADK61_24260 [Streptomyces sp. XY66]|uniref:hypothetical protein n=1 Tax=Streptomyces sp. XY66 TaxID=1415563 RepID=UPI0006AFBC40|nr:hypothetical protein [Streptomyces sp. XY66]KOU73198.1 hypothetical protein ADK61_24260 [Streptomyces sp. XY66]